MGNYEAKMAIILLILAKFCFFSVLLLKIFIFEIFCPLFDGSGQDLVIQDKTRLRDETRQIHSRQIKTAKGISRQDKTFKSSEI